MAIALSGGLALVVHSVSSLESAWGQTSPSVADIPQMVRGGGYVIVFRHGATYPDQADTDPLHDDNVANQRQLNDKGRADAKRSARSSARRACRSASHTLAGSTGPRRRPG